MEQDHCEGHSGPSRHELLSVELLADSKDQVYLSETDRSHLRAKLRSLTRSKSSIEDLAKWILSRPECHVQIVHLWLDEIRSVHINQLVPFLYVANAVMLSSRPGGTELGTPHKSFRKGFMKIMPYAVKIVAKDVSVSSKIKVIKLFGLWLSKKLAPEESIENTSKVYIEAWEKNNVKKTDEREADDDGSLPEQLNTKAESETDSTRGAGGSIDMELSSVSPTESIQHYPDGSPYEPTDSYEDDVTKNDELKKFFDESCTQLNYLDQKSLLTMIRSEPDMRRLFLQKVPTHPQLEVHLKPLEGDRANCPKEYDLLALVESLCQLPSEDYDSRDTHNKFPDEFCESAAAVNLCQDSWSTNELSSSIRNALAILCIFLKRLDVEMSLRSDGTWKLQAFAKTQKEKLCVAEEVLKEEKLLKSEIEVKLEALKQYVDSLTDSDSSASGVLTLPTIISGFAALPSAEDLFVQTKSTP